MPDSSETGSARYVLTSQEVVGAFVVLGRTPPLSDLYSDLPPYCGTPPERLLDRRGKLQPALAAIFEALTDAGFSLAVDVYFPAGGAVSARFASRRAAPPYAVLARTPDGDWDVSLLTETEQLVAFVTELLQLEAVRSSDAAAAATLTPAAFAALTAFGDLLEEDGLRRRLDRDTRISHLLLAPLDPAELARIAAAGLAKPDTRWGVTLATLVGQGELAQNRSLEAMQAGLADLAGLDLVDEDGRPAGVALGLARAFAAPSAVAALVAAHSRKDGGAALERLAVWRAGAALLVGVWRGGNDPRLLVSERSAAALLRLLETAMTPPSEVGPAAKSRFCGSCGAAIPGDARFCPGCGIQVAAG